MFTEETESFWVSTGSQNRSKCCFVRRDRGRAHSGDRAAQEGAYLRPGCSLPALHNCPHLGGICPGTFCSSRRLRYFKGKITDSDNPVPSPQVKETDGKATAETSCLVFAGLGALTMKPWLE